jgi:dihydrodipicolinate synthase/N-acetylneuraminate lyase
VSGVKAAMDLFGFEGGFPRKPLKPLGEKEKEALGEEIRELLAVRPKL